MTPIELRNLAAKLRTITVNKQDDVFIGRAADEIVKALAEIDNLKAQLKSELAAHESWQNEHLRVDGEQCRQIRGLEEERDTVCKKAWQSAAQLCHEMYMAQEYQAKIGYCPDDYADGVSVGIDQCAKALAQKAKGSK